MGNGVIGQHVWFWPRRVQVRALVPQLCRCAWCDCAFVRRMARFDSVHRLRVLVVKRYTRQVEGLVPRKGDAGSSPAEHTTPSGPASVVPLYGMISRIGTGRRLCAFRAGARVFLVGTRCPGQHRGKAPCDRSVSGKHVTSPWLQGRFESGRSLDGHDPAGRRGCPDKAVSLGSTPRWPTGAYPLGLISRRKGSRYTRVRSPPPPRRRRKERCRVNRLPGIEYGTGPASITVMQPTFNRRNRGQHPGGVR
jgi:hypothetical protein